VKLTDRRLREAANLEDLRFRFYFRDEDNRTRRTVLRESILAAITGFVSPDRTKIWGVDISGRWDGVVDFAPTAHAGAKFAVIKAIDGTVPTQYWKENTQRAIDAGLLFGAYGWLYPDNRVSCTLQARAYVKLLNDAVFTGDGNALPPVIDFEWTRYAGLQANPNYSDLRKWLTEFIRASGRKPILYSAAGYINMFGKLPDDILEMLAGVWLASYGGTQPVYPMGLTHWDMWQFSAFGDALTLCPGNQGKLELDLNYMQPEFYERYSGTTEPQTEGEPMSKWYRVTASVLNIRNGPGASYIDVGDLVSGDLIEVVETIGGWHHVDNIWRGGALIDCPAVAWCSGAYTVLAASPLPPPVEPPAELPARVGLVYEVNGVVTEPKWYAAE
jgi:GH25 family lysozyme M1 (1,4-beta-N-acetylmuramidase)